MKTAAQLLEELKAEEELRARGYTRTKCCGCNGTGKREACASLGFKAYPCPTCKGTGKTGWSGPLVR